MFPSFIDCFEFVKDFGLSKVYCDCMSIGQRISGARLAKGYRVQADFARACGMDRQYIHNLENDKVVKADPHNLARIAKLLGVGLNWLVTGEGKPDRLSLDDSEIELIAAFRKMPPEKQASVVAFLNSML